MRRKIVALGLAACLLGATGCDMLSSSSKSTTAYTETTEAGTASSAQNRSTDVSSSENTKETASQEETEPSAEAVTTPETTKAPVQIPTTADVETADPMVSTRDASGYIKHVEFSLFDFVYHYDNPEQNFYATLLIPQVYTKDKDLYKTINDSLINNSEADFRKNIVLKDLEVNSYYEIMTENDEILSYYMTRKLHHLDAEEGVYREYDEMKSAFTMERRTGKIFCLEDVYGMDQVVADIKAGNYTVISGDPSVFSKFTNEQLSMLYSKYTTVTRDDDHKYDFYLKDGKVCILIWAGQNYGGYVRLQLGDSKLQTAAN
ncbi:MAG: hypothetical protein IK125_08700 [Lachnospiraceae bacterium]|nr:hypothetical protein [Lachnospiraceae bacterium]